MEVTAQTLVLIDNSLSVSDVNKEIMKLTLKYLFSHTPEGRSYCFAPFSHGLDYAESYTFDYTGLEDMAKRLEFADKDVSLSDTLTEIIDSWNESDFACRDIVLFTDGLFENANTHEREEMLYVLQNSNYPVYVVFLDQENNKDALKDLLAVSRLSGGELFHTEFPGSDADCERQVSEQLLAKMEEYAQKNWEIYEQKDEDTLAGSDEHLKSEETEEIEGFTPYENEEIADVINEDYQLEEYYAGPYDETYYDNTLEDDELSPAAYGFLAAGLFSLVCISFFVWCIILRCKRKSHNEEEAYRQLIQDKVSMDKEMAVTGRRISEKTDDYITDSLRSNFPCNETVALLRRPTMDDEDRGTRLLRQVGSGIELSFEDAADPSKYYRIVVQDSIVLGRTEAKCDIAFNYDDSVSGRHCEIIRRDAGMYIKDLSSSNGTYINGNKVYTESELMSGDLVKLGTLSLIVRF